jgi:hypothetical protein
MPKDILELPILGRAAEVRAVDEAARTIDVVWTTGAVVQRRRWEGWDDVVEYDEELVVSGNAVRLERLNAGAAFLDSHRGYGLANVLGSVVPGSVRLEGGSGHATIKLTAAPGAADQVQRILEKSVRSVSVGYRVHRYEITKAEGQREHWRAVDWEPFEISAVAIGADPGAQVRSAEKDAHDRLTPCVLVRQGDPAAPGAAPTRGQTMPKDRQAADEPAREDGATDSGTQTRTADPAETSAKSSASTPTRAAETPRTAPTPPVDADAIRAEERRRMGDIGALCRRHGLDGAFANDLVARGVTLDAARTAILDRLAEADPMGGRSYEPVHAQARRGDTGEAAFRDALTEALLHRHDPSRNPLSDRAREFRGLTLLEMARGALERGGQSTRGLSKMELAGLALRAGVGYHTTSDFSTILANVANQTLRAAYATTPRTFEPWARRATITDFKPVSRAQLGGAPDLERVLEAGEFQYGTIGEGKEVYALATYGRIVAITRQVLINDDLDAFTRLPAAFGASAADLESDIVYQVLLANPAMSDGEPLFSAAHGNLGTAAIVNETSLAEAWRMAGRHRGIEGRLVSVLPRTIIVPPGPRSVEARKQVTATTPGSTSEVNTFAGRLQVVEEPRLIPDAGEDPWFLAADPARIDTVEYAYLEGQEGVFTETRTGFEVDGIEIKARHDFAAKAIDWRGLFKNAGAAPA